MINKIRLDWEKIDQIKELSEDLYIYLKDNDILKLESILNTLNNNIVEELKQKEQKIYNNTVPLFKVGKILELDEIDDIEYIEYRLIGELLDFLKYEYYNNRDLILNNYISDKISEIDRIGDINDYITDIEYIDDYNHLIDSILDNIMDSINPIGYIDYMYIYDIIEYNHDSYFLINNHGWETVIIDYIDNTFKLDDYTYKIDDIARL